MKCAILSNVVVFMDNIINLSLVIRLTIVDEANGDYIEGGE